MAMTFSLDTTIEAPPDEVFRRASDVGAFAQWMPGFVRLERLNDMEGVGQRFREVRTMFGREASEVFEIRAYEPPSRLELFVDGTQGSSKRGAYHFTYGFEALEDGRATKVTLSGAVEGMGCMGAVFGFLFQGMFTKAIRKDLEALKAWIEGGTRA